MPGSYSDFKEEIKRHLCSTLDPDSNILDVGAGLGTYGLLLRDYFNKIDAIEIFEPYINHYNLKNIYSNVFLADIKIFNIYKHDYIIMGDVFEHLSQYDSIKILDKINGLNKKCLIAVPYMYPQGECYGNIHETHLQPDLTEDKMIKFYSLNKLFGNNRYGYFINY
jgi:hypothetical protein